MHARMLAALALLLIPASLEAATLRLTATFPGQGNDAPCGTPAILSPAPAGVTATRLHYRWTGPAVGEDSVATAIGALGPIAKPVPVGAYMCTGWASWVTPDLVYAAGCPDTVTKVLYGPPARIIIGQWRAAPSSRFRDLIPTSDAWAWR